MTTPTSPPESQGRSKLPIGVAIGTGLGVTLGAATHNLGVWLPIGVAVGVALGVALSRKSGS